jgi:hypothetical protein
MGVYWVPGEMEFPFVGPDVFVARNAPAREDAAVYLTYEDGPLTLVVEIASPSTRKMDRHKRDTQYALELAVPWYLWIDLPQRVLALSRLVEGRYEQVLPDAEGRVWCDELKVGFAWQPDRKLVRVLAADGTVLPTADEIQAQKVAAEARAAREAQRAEEAEQRATALSAELERLRQALGEARDSQESEPPQG